MNTSISYVFRLYIADDAPNSRLAHANLEKIASTLQLDNYQLEIVDVLENPKQAMEDEVIVTPMLVKLSPLPECRIIGNLNDHDKVAYILDLQTEHEKKAP